MEESKIGQFKKAGNDKIAVLQCTTNYPSLNEDANIKAMVTMGAALNTIYGYSDHIEENYACYAAVALGGKIIEKHFTLDCSMEGPDHKASLEPEELKAMLLAIRNIEVALGDGTKRPMPSEVKNIPAARKSLFAIRNIKKGEIFNETNIAPKRPGTGISPMHWDEIIGTTASRSYEPDEAIEL